MRRYQEEWRFNTANFAVVFEVADCEDNPRDSFESSEDIEAIESGRCFWFDARVRVLARDAAGNDKEELGCDNLSGCAYDSVREFYTAHRTCDDMNRNCEAMRKVHGSNAAICHYFPGMVYEAIGVARSAMRRLRATNVT